MLISFLKHHVGREDLTGRNSPHVHGIKIVDLCTEPGNRMRLFIVEDADTYANYIPTNEYLIDEDDEHYESALHREERRAEVCSAMSIPLHTSPYEIRIQMLYGVATLVTATLVDDEQGLLRAVATNDSGTPVAVPCGKRVDDSEVVKLTIGDERIINASDYRTISVTGPTAWIEYERGYADTNFNATQYSYAVDVIVQSVPPEASLPISPQECMVLIARVIGLANEAAARKEATEATRRNESANVERAQAARTCLTMNPGFAVHSPTLRLNAANVNILSRLTGAHDEHVMRLYPVLSAAQWREWISTVNQVRSLSTVRFVSFALNIIIHRMYAAGIATPSLEETVATPPAGAPNTSTNWADPLDAAVGSTVPSDVVQAFVNGARPVPPTRGRSSSRAFAFADETLRNYTAEMEEQMRRLHANARAFTAQAQSTTGRPN